MLHVFHLGPVVLGARRAWLVGAIDEFGGFVPPVLELGLEKALKLMVEGFGGEDISLEPALAAFAHKVGIPVAPRPDYLEAAPAMLAFAAVNGHEGVPRGTGIQTFLEACRDYGAVAPWDRFRCDQPIQMTLVARNRETTREAIVLGGHGEPCGLALHDRPGDAERCVAALRRGDARAALKLDAITLAFGPEPDWALQAVRSAFSLPEFPGVFRTRRGHPRPATMVELGLLTVALGAVTLLSGERGTLPVECVECIDGDEFRARAFPPERRTRPRALPSLAAASCGRSGRLH